MHDLDGYYYITAKLNTLLYVFEGKMLISMHTKAIDFIIQHVSHFVQ